MFYIGVVSVLLGLFLVVSALNNWEWYLAAWDFAIMETLFGESAARWSCGLAGVFFLGFGVYFGITR